MAARQEKIGIKVFSSVGGMESADDVFRASEHAVLRLARLIGRQIAREQFARDRGETTETPRQLKSGRLP